MFSPKFLIIHHSATKDNQKALDVIAIRDYHINTMGWADIAYHFVIEEVFREGHLPTVEAIVGRPMNIQGAHCGQGGMNHQSWGICVVGNFDIIVPSEETLRKLISLLRPLQEFKRIPTENILGHREVAKDGRTCPGTLFNMDKLREKIRG